MIKSLFLLPAALLASAAVAQTAPQTVPGLDNFSLPSSQPTPVPSPSAMPEPTPTITLAPLPSPTPTARRTPRAIRPRASASPRATPTSRVTPSPMPSASTQPLPSVTPSPVAPPVVTPAPTVVPTPIAPEPTSSLGWWPWLAGAALLALAAGWALLRGRSRQVIEEVSDTIEPEGVAAEPEGIVAEPAVVAATTAARPSMLTRTPLSVPRAWIELQLHPRRGGLNMISATVESEIVIRNAGNAPAEAVVVEVTLLPARAGQDDDLGALFARPLARSAVPAFALAAGEERRVRVVSALPLAGLEPLVAGGREMLVPVVAVNSFYRWGEVGAGQTAAAFVVGVAREGQAKLAPFWLDSPRMHEVLAARPHAVAVKR